MEYADDYAKKNWSEKMPRHGSMKNLDLKEWQRMARFIADTESSQFQLKSQERRIQKAHGNSKS